MEALVPKRKAGTRQWLFALSVSQRKLTVTHPAHLYKRTEPRAGPRRVA